MSAGLSVSAPVLWRLSVAEEEVLRVSQAHHDGLHGVSVRVLLLQRVSNTRVVESQEDLQIN